MLREERDLCVKGPVWPFKNSEVYLAKDAHMCVIGDVVMTSIVEAGQIDHSYEFQILLLGVMGVYIQTSDWVILMDVDFSFINVKTKGSGHRASKGGLIQVGTCHFFDYFRADNVGL